MIGGLLTKELVSGAGTGAMALAAVLVLVAARRRTDAPALPVAGLALVAAGLAGLTQRGAPAGVVAGLAALAAAGLAADAWPACRPGLSLLALPGAFLVSSDPALAGGPRWLPLLVVAVIALGGPLAGSFDHRWREAGYGPVLMAITVGGVYLTVPDTERVLVLLGAAAVLALTGWPVPLASLGWGGSLAATGLVVWAAGLDGLNRPSSIIGAVACLGLLAVEPVARGINRRASPLQAVPPGWLSVPIVAAAHLAVVVVASRGAGLRTGLAAAAVIAAADLVVALVLALGIAAMAGSGRDRPVGY